MIGQCKSAADGHGDGEDPGVAFVELGDHVLEVAVAGGESAHLDDVSVFLAVVVEAVQAVLEFDEVADKLDIGIGGRFQLRLMVNVSVCRAVSAGFAHRLGNCWSWPPGAKLVERRVVGLLVLDRRGEAFQQLRKLPNPAHKLLMLRELLTEMVVDLLELIDQPVEALL
jgi:hypothetical protein